MWTGLAIIWLAFFADQTSEDWLKLSVADRDAALFDRLELHPRTMRLENAVLRFIDLDDHPGVEEPSSVLFIHGHGGSLGDFGPQILEARKRHRVVALDLPGFGNSYFCKNSDYGIERYAALLYHFIEVTQLRNVHLVCHSLGGQICLSIALKQPSFLDSVTLIDAAGVYDKSAFVSRVTKKFASINLGRLVTKKGRTMADFFHGEQTIMRRFLYSNSKILVGLESFQTNYRDQIRRLRVPTLVIWGVEDPIFSVDNAFFLKENLPDSTLYVVEGAGHSPNLSHPELVSRWIELFVSQHGRKVP